MADMVELDQLIAARAAAEPELPGMVDAVVAQRALLRRLAARREELGLTQETIARRLKTRQPNITRLEQGRVAPALRTVIEYAHHLGYRVALVAEPAPRRSTARAASTPEPVAGRRERRGAAAPGTERPCRTSGGRA